jgi:hypothetical protein
MNTNNNKIDAFSVNSNDFQASKFALKYWFSSSSFPLHKVGISIFHAKKIIFFYTMGKNSTTDSTMVFLSDAGKSIMQ